MTSSNDSRDVIKQFMRRTLEQLMRYLHFDGGVLYWHTTECNVLWPVVEIGTPLERVAPLAPSEHIVFHAFRSNRIVVAGESMLASVDEAWLREAGAKVVVALPVHVAAKADGVVVLFARHFINVDDAQLRAVSVLSAQLPATIRRSPFFVTAEIQSRQMEILSRVVASAACAKPLDDAAIFETIAKAARLLTGAHIVALCRPSQDVVWASSVGRSLTISRMTSAHRLRRPVMKGVTIRHQLADRDLVLTLTWRSLFEPTTDQRRLVVAIADALATLDSFCARVAMAEREQRALYLAAVSKAMAVSLDSSTVIAQMESLLVPTIADVASAELYAPDRWVSLMDEPRIWSDQAAITESNISVALAADDRLIGILRLHRFSARGAMTIAERELCQEVAAIAARALINAVSFRRERDTATFLQSALLSTRLPTDSRLLFDSVYVPADIDAHVGGDWYDVFQLDEDRFAVSLGDVGGHGVSAAVTMNVVRLALRAAVLAGCDPVRVLELGDRMLQLEPEAPIVTAIYGVIDLQRKCFTFASAGHSRPLVLRADGAIEEIAAGGVPLGLGMRLSANREEREVKLDPGETLVLYTDGLLEYGRDLLAGERRLQEVLQELFAEEPRATLARAIHSKTFSEAVGHDDVAILTVSLLPTSRAVEWRMPAVPASVPMMRKKLNDFLAEAPCLENRRPDILLAAGEALANAVEHAYEPGDGLVTLRASFREATCFVRISDQGTFKAATSKNGRGFGVRIMKAVAEEACVTGTTSGTEVNLSFTSTPLSVLPVPNRAIGSGSRHTP